MKTPYEPPKVLSVLGIAGSLRKKSFNRALLQAAAKMAPESMDIRIYEGLGDLPLYNEDVQAKGDPDPVRDFKSAILAADALLIATPEYNYGIPGVLKNAIDWASRPAANSVMIGKPAGIIGATPGGTGTARAQMSLRQSFVFTQTLGMLHPEVLVSRAHEKFNEESGEIIDERTRLILKTFLEALAQWTYRLQMGEFIPKSAIVA